MHPENLTAVEAVSAIRSGRLTATDYLKALLSRVDQLEPQIRAWVTLDREAVLEEARQLDSEAQRGTYRGPLHGIPVGVKDIFYTRDLKTTMGASAFRNFVPHYDAAIITRLKQAGALLMGKCVTTVLVFLDPGPTRNPWNTAHTPGGSSSGSAAAVAARMCPLTIGSQTVGSVGRPGAYNGVVSLMVTQSRISLAGAFPLAWSLDHVGAFSRSVADLRLLTETLSKSSGSDAPAHPKIAKLRVGLIRDFFYENADAESRSQLDALTRRLLDAGFQIEEVKLPPIFALMPSILRTIVRAEAGAVHDELIHNIPETYGPKLRELVQVGMLVDAQSYLKAQRARRQYKRQMGELFEHCDVLLTPAARGTAPEGIGATGDPVMNGPWTLADFPTMTLPYALGENGLPLGIQVSAPPLQEGLLFDAAEAMESVIGFNAQPNL